MSTTTITGASDDLIELNGQIREEFSAITGDDERHLLAFSDGTLLEITYDDDGIWRIKSLAKGQCEQSLVQGVVASDTFDVMTLTGDIKWAMLGVRSEYNPAYAAKKPA